MGLKPGSPGLEALGAQVVATLAGSPPAVEERSAEVSVALVGEAVFLVQATFEDGKRVATEGNRAQGRMTITNFGNCKILLTFEATGSKDGSLKLPEPITLDTEASGLGHVKEVVIDFKADAGPWG